ncbi:MAG: glycosyltransferase [Bacteroidaceae bacterium]|nr:glycosyltransferase [Bacteroidaceae bacterium]
MKLSVVVPVYNVEEFLERCVNSILAQEFTDLEVVLVDDGSSDGSPAICDRLASANANVKCIHTPNGGPGTARNVGIDNASGEWVTFVDSDDEILPNMYAELMPHTAHVDLVCCSFMEKNEDGTIVPLPHSNAIYQMDRDETLRRFLMRDAIYSGCITKIYKKSMLDEKNLRFPLAIKSDEDCFFNLNVLSEIQSAVLVDIPYYIYTNRPQSLSKDYFRSHAKQFFDNTLGRLTFTEDVVRKRFPQLLPYLYAHNLYFHNLVLGRAAMCDDENSRRVFGQSQAYMRKHFISLLKNHRHCGFSVQGALLTLLPTSLYFKYRQRKV